MQRHNTILEVSNLTIRRGGVEILREVNWTLLRGQHWVILGANGSGKTSLLSSLTGYLPPTQGTITVLGKTYGRADWRELRKEIGIVSSSIRQMMADSEPALDSVVSGKYAMIDYWGRVSPNDRRAGMRILRQIECEYLAKRPWIYLSQGERQRVLIGRAMMGRPKLLILDEPCAGLDPVAREHFLQFLQRLGNRRGAPTLVLVTHHVEEIQPVFSHVLVLKAGKVLCDGPRKTALNSRALSEAFGNKVTLKQRAGRYELAVVPARKLVI